MATLSVFVSLLLVFLAPLSFADKCSDGTWTGYCSTVNPGKVCEGGSLLDFKNAPDRMAIIQKDPQNFADCKCPTGQMLDLTNYNCKSSSCTDNGVTTLNGSCVPNNQPKFCLEGTLMDKASSCRCPATADIVGETCRAKTGCIVNQPACDSNSICNTTTNACQKKVGCAYDNPSCATSNSVDYECDVNSNQCFKKTGCLYDNPSCSSDQKCVSNNCVAKDAPVTSVTVDDGSSSTDDGSSQSKGKLLCCPLIAVLMLVVGSAAMMPRKQ